MREAIVWDRELTAVIVSHTVADVDRWRAGYDEAGEMQRSLGIVGHAANQVMDEPSRVVVYHQAESFDDLRAFSASDDLRAAMEALGVTSAPEITFWTGSFGERY